MISKSLILKTDQLLTRRGKPESINALTTTKIQANTVGLFIVTKANIWCNTAILLEINLLKQS